MLVAQECPLPLSEHRITVRQSRSWDSWRQARVHGSQALLRAARVRGVRVVRASRASRPETLGAAGSAIADVGRRGGGERWRAAAAGMAHRVAPDM